MKNSKPALITVFVTSILTILICAGILIYRLWWPVYHEVPLIYTSGGAPAIEVMIDGQGPFKMLVDTGFDGNLCMVRSGLIEELQLEQSPQYPSASAYHAHSDDAILFPLYGPSRLSIGAFRVSNFHYIEQPDSPVDDYLIKAGLDGVMGMGIFEKRHLIVAFDFDEHRFRFASSIKRLGLSGADQIETIYLQESSSSSTQQLGVRVTVSGTDLEALLDTGSAFGLGLSMDSRAELSLRTDETEGTSVTVGGEMKTIYSTLNGDLIIGPRTIPHPAVKFSDRSSPTVNVGMKILRDYAVIAFDYRHEQIYLKPRSEDQLTNDEQAPHSN